MITATEANLGTFWPPFCILVGSCTHKTTGLALPEAVCIS
jgi:hypothetical protein